MKIIEPSVEILNPPDYNMVLRHIESAARTCYQSESKDSFPEPFIKRLIRNGHESVIEHISISVRFICDRGVSHELVRHRLCSFSQESTRFCRYSGEKFGSELTFIRPCFYSEGDNKYTQWEKSMRSSEYYYFNLIEYESSAQEARSVLPNSLKTDIVVTANIRQWRTMFEQRCASAAHPSMQQIMLPLLKQFAILYPVFFIDVYTNFCERYDFFNSKGYKLAEIT